MGLGDFINDLGKASDWVDQHVLGKPKQETQYKTVNGRKVPVAFSLANQPKPNNIISRNIAKPAGNVLETATEGLNWLYSNGISQPISTFLLMGKQARTSDDDPFALSGKWFDGGAWARSWRTAEHVSPGQSFWLNHSEGDKAITAAPVYAMPSAAGLPAEWKDMSPTEQQDWLAQKKMPIVGNQEIQKLQQDNQWFNFASGAGDFAARWWLDPTVLGGKVVGGARAAALVKPRPKGGWSGGDIDDIMAGSTMGKAQDFLFQNRDNPALINNLSMFKKSALGPRAGGIVSALQSPEEVHLFLRTSLGDVAARAELESRNTTAAARMQQDTARLPALDLALSRVQAQANPAAEAMIQAEKAKRISQINADENLTSRYKAALDHYGELDALNLTRWSFARAERRTTAQAGYRTGPALATQVGRANPANGVGATRINANDFFGNPMTMIRSFNEAHPNGTIQIDDISPESIAELRGHLARIPQIGPGIRQSLLNDYLKTNTEGERLDMLDQIGHLGVSKVAEKHGFTADEAEALYQEHRRNVANGQEELRRYSAAALPGEAVHVDEFMGHGGKLTVHPNMVTRLANDHVLIDLKALDTTLARNSGALKALRTRGGTAADWLVDSVDHLNHLWKFGTLFRAGYIPRVLGDDIAGQVARVGAASMALRTGYGVKNLATNLAHWKPARMYEAQEASLREGAQYADDELATLQPQAAKLQERDQLRTQMHQSTARAARDRARRVTNKLNALPPGAPASRIAAHKQLIKTHERQATAAEQLLKVRTPLQDRLDELNEQVSNLQAGRKNALSMADEAKAKAGRGLRQESQLYRRPQLEDGTVLPAAFGGREGEYFQKMISSDDALRTMFDTNKKIVHRNLMDSFSKSGVSISYPQNESAFVNAWHQAINNQIMQDELATQAVKGASIDDMGRWLSRTPAGRAYRKKLGLKYTNNEQIATSVYHDVNAYLPDPVVRQAALDGKADLPFLADAAQQGRHPFEVHTTSLGENLAGSNRMSRGLDRVIDKWFKVVASLPADRMSRHPLFNQLYAGHARSLAEQQIEQGGTISLDHANQLATAARRLALKDTRNLVFDIAHRSDAAHMLRFISPFFAATTEAYQRWSRIIADRPQVIGYAQNIFHAPISLGWMQDQDGNQVLADGTSIDPATGKRKVVPKGERYIMARVPKFIADGPVGKAMGLDKTGKLPFAVSQNSLNIITQGDPWFNPGTGPLVAIPVNEFVKDKPSDAELARHLGILPFGPTAGSPLFGNTPLGRAADLSMPSTVKNFLTAFDTSDTRYQQVKLQITQQAAYEHANLGKPMPSASKIASMTRNYWLQSAAFAFTQPAATTRKDPYQFYRDQYNALRRKDPLTADQEFLDRFGSSYFIFAQATSKNNVGAQATKKAVELSQQYADVIAKNPDLGALIIGPEGNGPFSPEAYTYQLTHPLSPGDSEMQRSKMSANDAMDDNERRLGWSKYTQLTNAVTAQLHAAGFDSFDDAGAEQFKAMRSGISHMLGDAQLPDGSANPYYNAKWSADFNSFDPGKYDRLIPGLSSVANSSMADDPSRTDLRSLRTYLLGRTAVQQVLAERAAAGGAKTLTAQANVDVARAWGGFVDGLIEKDTRFGDLHSRYLSRDLGVDVDDLAQQMEAA